MSSFVPSPFSYSGIGATLFFACWRVAYGHVSVGKRGTDSKVTYVSRGTVNDVLALDGTVVRRSVSVARHVGLVCVMGLEKELLRFVV